MKHLLLIFALMLFCISVYAHPASDVTAKYSAANQTLTINFDHVVKDASDHYISGIEVRLAGKMIISQVASAQDNLKGGEFIYKIPNLRKGDILEITTICNKTGKKSVKMTLP
jgi:hypothetical protein